MKMRMPAHHDVRAKDVDLKRLGAVLAVSHERELQRLRVVVAAGEPRSADAAVAGADRGSHSRHADALHRSGALLVRASAARTAPVPGAAEDLRRVDRRAAPQPRCRESWRHRKDRRHEAAREVRAGRREAVRARSRLRRGDGARARDLAVARRPHGVRPSTRDAAEGGAIARSGQATGSSRCSTRDPCRLRRARSRARRPCRRRRSQSPSACPPE